MLKKDPESVTLPLKGPIMMYILQISVAILKCLVMLLMYILTCLRRPIPMYM